MTSRQWEPHTPVLQRGIFASKFPGQSAVLWTLVNRNDFEVSGYQIQVEYREGVRFFDLWHGVELTPKISGAIASLAFDLEGRGYGAILATARLTPPQLALLAQMRSLSNRPLSTYSADWNFLPQRVVEISSTKRTKDAPARMIKVPAGNFEFIVSGVEVEGEDAVGVDVQMPWENSPRRHHRHDIEIASFYMDRTPVTNAEYKKFLDATHYRPKDDHNFLRDWKDGIYPAGWDAKPVTWVSLEDARAYAAWAGKRLPHEWEWQYAMQGSDGRPYPWGTSWNPEAVSAVERGRVLTPPDDVETHPRGTSAFGLADGVGSVWQWTDEYQDAHTRSAILRGGSNYWPGGSNWYFPRNATLNQHAKYLLMAPGIDRSATIGFRCVVDAE